jgi:hypothetical protein
VQDIASAAVAATRWGDSSTSGVELWPWASSSDQPAGGVTTALVVMFAWAFGLNQVASQIGAHGVTPLHLLLFIPFIELGVHLFHTRRRSSI